MCSARPWRVSPSVRWRSRRALWKSPSTHRTAPRSTRSGQRQDRGWRHLRPAGLHLESAEEASGRGLSQLARRQSARGHAARPVLLPEQDRDRGRGQDGTAPAPARSPSSAAASDTGKPHRTKASTAGVGFHSFTREFDKDKSYTADDLKLVVQRTQTEVFERRRIPEGGRRRSRLAAADAAAAGNRDELHLQRRGAVAQHPGVGREAQEARRSRSWTVAAASTRSARPTGRHASRSPEAA